jgi:hypothetical protein
VAEQLGVGGIQLVELELVALLAAVVLEAPASALHLAASARVLDHPVQGDVFSHDNLAHAFLLFA